MLAAAALLRLVPVWAFLAGHHPGLRTSVQNPCIRSGTASNRLVLCTASDDVPNSISNHTLQAMLAARRKRRDAGGGQAQYRQAIDEAVEEYVCPLTAKLPLDPVTAEDGRFYERHAIEEWFSRQPEAQVKSPVTNELMGKRLFPAVQVRNSLKRLVESGAICGSKADAWTKAIQKAMEEEEVVAALRARAEGGDASAMSELGCSYREGLRGLKKDDTQAFTWFKRAADLNDVRGLTNGGVLYLNGEGVKRSPSRGLIMLGAAAALGSEHACGILGWANAAGRWGLEKNPQEATRWYREMQKCDRRYASENIREKAAAWLREHP